MPAATGAESSVASWIATWGAAQTAPYGSETLPAGTFDATTLRQVVHVSAGGNVLRIRLSNVFGESPLKLLSVRIARGSLDSASHTVALAGPAEELRFQGRPSVEIPAGAEYLSDPVPFALAPLSDLVIDMEIAHAPALITMHAGARATSFWGAGRAAGERVFDRPHTSTRWYFLSGVQVERPQGGAATIVALGDSITDGHGATTDGNDRWTDVLAARLAADPATHPDGVVNAGIGGNRLLGDGIGPSGLSRFDRDVLARPGVRYLVVLEGINDIGTFRLTGTRTAADYTALLAQIEGGLAQVAARAHEHGILVYGGTLTPFAGNDYYHPDAAALDARNALNQWIRSSGTFDAVIDFDALLRDPADPSRLLPAEDSGDHLHPSPAGYRAMGDAIAPAFFQR